MLQIFVLETVSAIALGVFELVVLAQAGAATKIIARRGDI